MSKPLECAGCPYSETGGTFVPPDQHGDLLRSWGEAPGREEAEQRRGFVGPSGRLLRSAEAAAGLKVFRPTWKGSATPVPDADEDVLHCNTVLCRPPGNKFPGMEIAWDCLMRHQGSVWADPLDRRWIAFGANATEALTGFRPLPLKTRGSMLPVLKDPLRWVISTIHPAFIQHKRKEGDEGGKSMDYLYPFLVIDITRALNMPQVPNVPRVKIQEPLDIYRAWWEDGKPNLVALDIEGGDGKPNLVGLSWKVGEARVMGWSNTASMMLSDLSREVTLVLHNASYDLPELLEVGVPLPKGWIDTINLGAALNPQKGTLGLEFQVLTYVPGSLTWKGLINHKGGYESTTQVVDMYVDLWSTVLSRMGRRVPSNRWEWYCFYNGLDVAWDLELAYYQRKELEAQGRMGYYRELMQPLQDPLLRMGLRGLRVDVKRREHHKVATQRLQRISKKILDQVTSEMLQETHDGLLWKVEELEQERATEWDAYGKRKFSKAGELSKARTALRSAEKRLSEGFSVKSYKQKVDLFYGWLGLPEVRNGKTKGPATDEEAIDSLISRLERGTVKPKRASQKEALRVLRAVEAGNKWAHWEANYLSKPLVEGSSVSHQKTSSTSS